MSVSSVSKMSVTSLTPLSFICQWLYKIVSKSIYRVYLKSINKKKSIKKREREYRNPLTADKFGQSVIGQWFALSVRALTKVLTTDKKRARMPHHFRIIGVTPGFPALKRNLTNE